MDKTKRNEILHALLAENPDLAGAIQEADEEGAMLYGQSYVQGIDFLVLTLEGTLLIPAAVYEKMRAAMTAHPSVAWNN
jgi:hypothetical protein